MEQAYEGTITEVKGGAITIELSGRLGRLTLPLRLVVGDEALVVGQTVRFMMSYPEIVQKGEKT